MGALIDHYRLRFFTFYFKPIVRAKWRLKILEGPSISQLIDEFLERARIK
jgi:predicted GTPase